MLGLAIGGVILVIVIVALVSGGDSPSTKSAVTPPADAGQSLAKGSAMIDASQPPAAFPASEDGARSIIAELRTNSQLAQLLEPRQEDYVAIFEGAAAATAETYYRTLYTEKLEMKLKPEQTEMLVARATTEQLRQGIASEFPGGYREIADKLKPGLVFYRWKYVKPGETMGMAFDGLVHVNGRWVWVPKPFRALR